MLCESQVGTDPKRHRRYTMTSNRVQVAMSATMAQEIAQHIAHERTEMETTDQVAAHGATISRIALFAGDATGRTAFYTIIASGDDADDAAVLDIAQAFASQVEEQTQGADLTIAASSVFAYTLAMTIIADGDAGSPFIVD